MNKNVNCVLSSYVMFLPHSLTNGVSCNLWGYNYLHCLFVFKVKYARDSPTKSYCAVGVN